jgi:hypothetical protein
MATRGLGWSVGAKAPPWVCIKHSKDNQKNEILSQNTDSNEKKKHEERD